MNKLAKAYKVVRDITVCNEALSNAEKIAVLELVKHEITVDAFNLIAVELHREQEA